MQNIKQYITHTDDGYELCIELNEQCGAYNMTGIYMFVAADAEEGCGDLAVSYDISNLQNDTEARTIKAGTHEMLLRNLHSEDEVTKAMCYFYWEHNFDKRLREILADAGFASASDVHTSEWGMQDEGRISYDAFELADEVREAMLVNA
ncbi:hypothetical protein UFOVP181_450 [uncultured Caudovirales phage]|uniref:Uncharacterized protein n=1 Tax=uncultured Caudovirales phage TaxID=2100421 RepID=A0A6J5L0T3_9CAUD|nr:hypothetical protein UFOVP57_191 [uncultured Caudovirales phage]CAB5209361.1 hypothetical protein UFOVP181_450 [uncultured Caudovirales phage]